MSDRIKERGGEPIAILPYQLWTVGYGPTEAVTGDGGSGSDTGEGA